MQRAPLVEPITDAPGYVLVTFRYRDAHAGHVIVMKGPEDPRSAMLERVPNSDAWARSYRLPADARFTYAFVPDFPLTPTPVAEFERLRWRIFADPLNPRRVGLQQSLCELPNA